MNRERLADFFFRDARDHVLFYPFGPFVAFHLPDEQTRERILTQIQRKMRFATVTNIAVIGIGAWFGFARLASHLTVLVDLLLSFWWKRMWSRDLDRLPARVAFRLYAVATTAAYLRQQVASALTFGAMLFVMTLRLGFQLEFVISFGILFVWLVQTTFLLVVQRRESATKQEFFGELNGFPGSLHSAPSTEESGREQ